LTDRETLDFLVIGAMKCGTTSLWEHMRSHPGIFVPGTKEAPFFSSDAQYSRGLRAFLGEHFQAVPDGVKAGKVTPQYMMGSKDAAVSVIAGRIAEALPDVRLIALLRDPVERAVSQHRHNLRKGYENRSFDDVAELLLEPAALHAARRVPKGTNTYVTAGEYGRVLDTYLAFFPRDQLFVAFTDDLEQRPEWLLEEIFRFVEVDPHHRPPSLERRFHKGGTTKRVSDEAARELKLYLDEHVWPKLGLRAERSAFAFWFDNFWNLEPDERDKEVDPGVRERLRAHFAEDGRTLEAIVGRPAPWQVEPGAALDQDPEGSSIGPTGSDRET
jgi:hypothetical protein